MKYLPLFDNRINSQIGGASFPIRVFITNESGYYLDISLYREVTDSRTGQVNIGIRIFVIFSLVFFILTLLTMWHVEFHHNTLATLRATAFFVLMHSGIVNEFQLLYDAHTVLKPHRGAAALFLFLLTIILFHFFFLRVCHSDSPFLGCLFSLYW